ncbi:MAG: hypothetical protein NC184_02335 [Roseburia sp.]|nr:hypothetical protein [Roseburia sp.]
MEQARLQLASGEKVIRSCDYRVATGKKYERVDNFTLTNKRLISRTNERVKDRSTIDSYEVPVEQIDTVKAFYRDGKQPIPIAVIIFAVILVVAVVAMFIADYATVGLVLIGVCAVMMLICILTRKRKFVFTLDVGRLEGRDTNEHLSTGAVTVKSAPVESKDGSKRKRRTFSWRSLIGLIAFIAAAAFLAVLIAEDMLTDVIDAIADIGSASETVDGVSGDVGGKPSLVMPIVCIVGFIVAMIVLVVANVGKVTAKRDGAKTSSRKIKVMPTASKVSMPIDEIKKFLDEVGALVQGVKTSENNKTKKEI